MGAFHYTALDAKGKRQKGVQQADSARQVRNQLRASNLTPLEVNPVKETTQTKRGGGLRKPVFSRVAVADIALLTRQLATLLSAAIPIDEALAAVAQQSSKPHIKSVLLGVRARVLEGHSLASALKAFPKTFSKLYQTTVAAGERTGKLDQILTQLAEYTERQHDIRRKIRQALLYPSLMSVVSVGIVIFLLTNVVPKIINVFSRTKQALPLSTTILIQLSDFIRQDGWYVLLGLLIAAFFFWRGLKRPAFRFRFDQFKLKLPIIGNAIKIINTARYGRTLGILTAASVPVLDAMQAAAQLVKPLPIQDALKTATHQVREGTSIAGALEQTGYFAPMFIHLVSSGEMSGKLEMMLTKAAVYQENDVEHLIESILALFEPIMILVMGAVVLFIVLSIMLPIFDLDQMQF